MTAIWFNRKFSNDEERRLRLYAGEIFVYDHLPSVAALAAFTREMIESALAPHDPRKIHQALSPAELAPLLGALKPKYTHHPRAQELVRAIMHELGIDLGDCHLDVPKLRTAYPTGHLTRGIAYAFPAHRDTWYGAPQAQLNWWMPVYPLTADNAMAFYPRYFDQPTPNDSERFNYYRRNVERKDVSKFIDEDPRVQPAAQHLAQTEPRFQVLPEVGGIIMFSGAQLHATVTGPTSPSRYSVDFRTVSRADVERGMGAPNVDCRCTGTALRDFRRGSDGTPMPEELARALDPEGPAVGELAVFEPALK